MIAGIGCLQERYQKNSDAGNEGYDLARGIYTVDSGNRVPITCKLNADNTPYT